MAFDCVHTEPYDQAFREISTHYAITYWDDIGAVVRDADQRGEDVYASDGGHWNERGHELVAQAIAAHLRTELPANPRHE